MKVWNIQFNIWHNPILRNEALARLQKRFSDLGCFEEADLVDNFPNLQEMEIQQIETSIHLFLSVIGILKNALNSVEDSPVWNQGEKMFGEIFTSSFFQDRWKDQVRSQIYCAWRVQKGVGCSGFCIWIKGQDASQPGQIFATISGLPALVEEFILLFFKEFAASSDLDLAESMKESAGYINCCLFLGV